MIVFEGDGDMLTSTIETIVAPTNTVGVMGNGLALALRLRYDGLYPAFKKACREKVFDKQGVFLWEYLPERKILCLPTKRYWGNPSKLEWIDTALESLARDWEALGITELAMPMIGCGKGELKWDAVRLKIWEHLDPIPLKVSIFLK